MQPSALLVIALSTVTALAAPNPEANPSPDAAAIAALTPLENLAPEVRDVLLQRRQVCCSVCGTLTCCWCA